MGIVKRGNEIAKRLSEKIKDIEGIDIPVYELNIRNFRDDIKDAFKVDTAGMNNMFRVDTDAMHTMFKESEV